MLRTGRTSPLDEAGAVSLQLLLEPVELSVCGRYTIGTVERLRERFALPEEDLQSDPRFNVSPSQQVPVIIRQESNHLTFMEWGLLPSWAKDPQASHRPVNARIEGILTKPTFRGPVRKHRCLIPADGFYEWKKEGKAKTPYYIHRRDSALFAFAGIYDVWRGTGGEIVESCAILTTRPNTLLEPIHNRMPVILEEGQEGLWLDPITPDTDRLLELLQRPYPADLLEAFPVSTRVNSPRIDRPELIQRTST